MKSNNLFIRLKKSILKEKWVSFSLLAIFLTGLFLRVYKVNELLSFYFDQGRDALVVWRLLHEGKFFLIGPVTGIEGIFLGPFYYYLVTPIFFFGADSPIFASVVLNVISALGIFLLFLVTKEFFDKKVALMACFITSLSYSLVVFSRWFSHPPLLPTVGLFILYALLQIYRGKEKWWIWLALGEGVALQLEAAAATFFIPTIIIFAFWQRKKIKNFKTILAGLVVFVMTLAPQIYFDVRHEGVLRAAFSKFLIGEKSFSLPFLELAKLRLNIYYGIFMSKFYYAQENLRLVLLGVLLLLGFIKRKEVFAGERKILWLWLMIPLFLYLLYQGNYGYFWDYYLSGIWMAFIIIASFLLVSLWQNLLGKFVFIVLVAAFSYFNVSQLLIYYKTGIGIIIRDQILAIDWIYKDAKKERFNVDVYVPPVIPHAYDYLFKWLGTRKYSQEPMVERASLLYTLYEVDGPHPERLESWLSRQSKIGIVQEEKKFGEITVQRRTRIE